MTRTRSTGFTLTESLLVLVLLLIAALLGASLVVERLHTTKIRVAAQQFAVHLRAARFTAVSKRMPVDVVVSADPQNAYQYTDVRGTLRSVSLPPRVRIVSSSSPITFLANGTVPGGGSTVMEVELSGSRSERWTIDTEALGVPRLSHERIEP